MKKYVNIVKCDHIGKELWRYPAELIGEIKGGLLVKALFNFNIDVEVDKLVFRNGDIFFEAYYWDEWYNILEVYDQDSGTLKGWYCNISYPIEYNDNEIRYRDLALDLLVYPDMKQVVLDRDEFEILRLSEEDRNKAIKTLKSLQNQFRDSNFIPLKPDNLA